MNIKTQINGQSLWRKFVDAFFSVPVRIKIGGIIALPVLILGVVLNYWIQTGLSDWLSWKVEPGQVQAAMESGSRSVLLVTGITALFSLLLTGVLMLILTKPLLELSDVAKDVAEGNTKSRARVWSSDEIGMVGESVNAMIDHLVESQEDLRRTNRNLRALNRVANAATQKIEIHDILYLILNSILDTFHLETGWIYLFDSEKGSLHLATWSGVPKELQATLLNTVDGNHCNCRDELNQDGELLNLHIKKCERLENIGNVNSCNRHVSIELLGSESKLGLINLMIDDDADISKDDLTLMKTIGAQVSEIVENAWLQLKLSEKEAARKTLLEALVRAEEDERSKLAMRLHDDAGQNLTSLLIRLKALEKRTTSVEMGQEVAELCTYFSETIKKIQGIAYQLRSVVLEELGIEAAIRTLIKEMLEVSGIEVECEIDSSIKRASFALETCLYRITQESMTNIVRHANADLVKIKFNLENEKLYLEIEDNGLGFDADSRVGEIGYAHIGLRGMRERAEMLGGSLAIESTPNIGTTIKVSLPYELERV